MPVTVNWLSTDSVIASVRLTDPFTQADLNDLQTEFAPSIDSGRPHYLLVDIRQFNALSALALVARSDGLPLPNFSPEQARLSRLAIVGSTAMVHLLLKMVDGEGSDQIRPFNSEEEAVAWLSKVSGSISSGG
jgi:hypothetical protein